VQYLYSEDYKDNSPKPQTPSDDWGFGKKDPKPKVIASEDTQNSPEPECPIMFNAKIYIIADQYNIPSLKNLAKTKYEVAVTETWDPVVFTKAVRFLWENTVESDRLMRDAVAEIAGKRIHILLECDAFVALMEAKGLWLSKS
jgi:hypothetical protein